MNLTREEQIALVKPIADEAMNLLEKVKQHPNSGERVHSAVMRALTDKVINLFDLRVFIPYLLQEMDTSKFFINAEYDKGLAVSENITVYLYTKEYAKMGII